ncbi:MAG: hypothetical protein RLZZ144_558, partial [Pseudomonadota bacterium]
MRVIIFLLLLLPFTANAATVQMEARAATEAQAKREALAALADSIFLTVKSETASVIEGSGKAQQSVSIHASSDIPLIGIELKCDALAQDFICLARLDSGKSLALYVSKLTELSLELIALDARLAKTTGHDRYLLLTQALTEIEQFEKYRAVAAMLGGSNFPTLVRNRADTEAQLRELESAVPSLELAAKLLSKNLHAEALFIQPAMPHASNEVTEFGRLLRDRLAQNLPTVASPDLAQTFFKGDYEVLANQLHVIYRLVDANGNTLETRVATLAPAAYKNIAVKPTTQSFDQLLHDGVALNNDFRAQLTTNRGAENILFNDKDEVELLVKLNRPGYFYVVGHVSKKRENYSYLLELATATSDRRFVRYVNADDVNKWLSIGKFEASAPFGVESLQLIASSDDAINRLPSHEMDKKTELNLIARNAEKGIAKTRAL